MGTFGSILFTKSMQSYVRALNHMVLEHPALYEEDFDPEWI